MKKSGYALLAVVCLMPSVGMAKDEVPVRAPDDRVIFDLSSEAWVATQTARVVVDVEAAVQGSNTGTARNDMAKAVDAVAKAEWRLTAFSRAQDQTGLERWSAQFEARIPENQLGGLGDAAKKQGKAGMQLTVATIDFSPTLAETQAAAAKLRADITKKANEQLATINETLPGKSYRLALIDFTSREEAGEAVPAPRAAGGRLMAMKANMAAMNDASAPMEKAEKLVMTAHVVAAAKPKGE